MKKITEKNIFLRVIFSGTACQLPNQQGAYFLITNTLHPLFEKKYFQKRHISFFNHQPFLFLNRTVTIFNDFGAILNIKAVKKHFYDLTIVIFKLTFILSNTRQLLLDLFSKTTNLRLIFPNYHFQIVILKSLSTNYLFSRHLFSNYLFSGCYSQITTFKFPFSDYYSQFTVFQLLFYYYYLSGYYYQITVHRFLFSVYDFRINILRLQFFGYNPQIIYSRVIFSQITSSHDVILSFLFPN